MEPHSNRRHPIAMIDSGSAALAPVAAPPTAPAKATRGPFPLRIRRGLGYYSITRQAPHFLQSVQKTSEVANESAPQRRAHLLQ